MLGPIIIVVLVVLVLPPMFLIAGLVFSALLGWALKDRADELHAGSELVDLNT